MTNLQSVQLTANGLLETKRNSKKGTAWFWALLPVLLLGSLVLGLSVMLWIAVHDPGFAVERDYYKKAVAWDNTQAQATQNQILGWQVNIVQVTRNARDVELILGLNDSSSQPLAFAQIDAEAFPNARANQVRGLHFEALGAGVYRSQIADARPGLWELRCSIEFEARRFTQLLRVELPEPGRL